MKYKSIFLTMLFLSLVACGSTTATNDEQTQEPAGNLSPSETLNELIKKGITVDVSSTIAGNWNVQGFSIGEEDPNIDTTSTITFNSDGSISEYSAKPLFNYDSCTFNQQDVIDIVDHEAVAYTETCPDSYLWVYLQSISSVCGVSEIFGECYSSSIATKDAGSIEDYITDIRTNTPDGTVLHGDFAGASISYTVDDAEYNLIVKFVIDGILYPIFICHSSQENCNTWATQNSLDSIEESETNGFLVVGADEDAIAMLNVASNYYVLLTRIE